MSNYWALANQHALQFAVAHAKSFLFSLSSLPVAWHQLPKMRFVGTELPKVAGDPTAPAPDLSVGFSFIWVGWLLHSVLTPIFCTLVEELSVSFMISNPRVCLRILLLTVLLLPRRSCCFMSQSLMLLLRSSWVHHLLLNIGPLGIPCVWKRLDIDCMAFTLILALVCSWPALIMAAIIPRQAFIIPRQASISSDQASALAS
jgi:hypothetical protein